MRNSGSGITLTYNKRGLGNESNTKTLDDNITISTSDNSVTVDDLFKELLQQENFIHGLTSRTDLFIYLKDNINLIDVDAFFDHFLLAEVIGNTSLPDYFRSCINDDPAKALQQFEKLQDLGLRGDSQNPLLRKLYNLVQEPFTIEKQKAHIKFLESKLAAKDKELELQQIKAEDQLEQLQQEEIKLNAANKSLQEANTKLAYEELPPKFLCPITGELMNDPVLTLWGYTYERAAVEEFCADRQESPLGSMAVAPMPEEELAGFIDKAAPSEFKCPISGDVMDNPVTVISGHTFEKENIVKWLASGKRTCPITRVTLTAMGMSGSLFASDDRFFVSNMALHQQITMFKTSSRSRLRSDASVALSGITKEGLVPNISLRKQIQDWKARGGSVASKVIAPAAAVAAKAAQTAQATHAKAAALLDKLAPKITAAEVAAAVAAAAEIAAKARLAAQANLEKISLQTAFFAGPRSDEMLRMARDQYREPPESVTIEEVTNAEWEEEHYPHHQAPAPALFAGPRSDEMLRMARDQYREPPESVTIEEVTNAEWEEEHYPHHQAPAPAPCTRAHLPAGRR